MSNTYRSFARVRIEAPKDATLTCELPLSSFAFNMKVSEPGEFNGSLLSQINFFGDPTNPFNPLQKNAWIYVDRVIAQTQDVDWDESEVAWRGQITNINNVIENGMMGLEIGAISKLGILNNTLASINGKRTGSLNTPTIDIDNASLGRIVSDALPEYAYFPLYSVTAAWLTTSFLATSDLLDANINNSVTTIVVSTNVQGFRPYGFILIGTELIFYNGYQNDGPGGKYRFLNCVRGVLGTSAAAHTAGDTVAQVAPKTQASQRAVFLEKQRTSDSEWLPITEFVPLPKDGCFGFQYDVLSFPDEDGPYNSTPRGTYAVYDEEGADAITIGQIIRLLLTEDKELGGPGWVENTDFIIDDGTIGGISLDEIPVARFTVDEPVYTWEAIEALIEEQGLSLGSNDDTLIVSENPATGIITFSFVSQKDDADPADCIVFGTIAQQEESTLADTASGICVIYEDVLKKNLLAADRCWHPSDGDTMAGLDVEMVIYQNGENGLEAATGGRGWLQTAVTTSNQYFVEKAFDGNYATAWGLQTTDSGALGAGPMTPLICWFPDNDGDNYPDLINISKFEFVLDLGWTAYGDIHVEAYGLVGNDIDFTTDPPTYTDDLYPDGNLIRLHGGAEVRFRDFPDDEANMSPFTKYEMKAEDVGISCRGILFKFDVPPRRRLDNKQRPTMAFRDLRVEGPQLETVLIQLTDQADQPAEYLYAPDSYDALLGHSSSSPRILNVEIGPSSRQGAISIGRAVLGLALLQIYTRQFTIEEYKIIPLIGIDTISIKDSLSLNDNDIVVTGHRGLVQHYEVQYEEGIESGLLMTIRDYKRGLLGAEYLDQPLSFGDGVEE